MRRVRCTHQTVVASLAKWSGEYTGPYLLKLNARGAELTNQIHISIERGLRLKLAPTLRNLLRHSNRAIAWFVAVLPWLFPIWLYTHVSFRRAMTPVTIHLGDIIIRPGLERNDGPWRWHPQIRVNTPSSLTSEEILSRRGFVVGPLSLRRNMIASVPSAPATQIVQLDCWAFCLWLLVLPFLIIVRLRRNAMKGARGFFASPGTPSDTKESKRGRR